MSGINLHLDDLVQHKSSDNSIMWVDVANMINTKYAVDTIAKKIVCIVSSDRKICDAINTLRNAKATIRMYGASESLMSVFNAGNMLSDVIGMEIPDIINDSNAKSVGTACCENIDETIVDAYEKVKTFFNQIVDSANQYFTKLKVQASCQSATIDKLIGHITDVDKLNAKDFSMDELFGYTHPVFMDRVNALQYISDNISAVGTSNEELKTFEPYLKILGYKVVEKSNESLLEGDDPATPAVVVEPETPEEQKADEPEPSTVLNPQPAEEPQSAPAPQPALTGDPSEVVSTEDPTAPAVTTVPVQSEGPTDSAQTQSMAVFRWTPSNIVIAAGAVKGVLASVSKFSGVCSSLSNVRGTVITAVEQLQSSDIEDKSINESTISSGRSYASFIGDVLAIYNNSINELVDQVVSMAGKVVAAKSDDGVVASTITEEDPFGIHATYQNADDAPKGGEQAAPDGEKPAEPAEDPKGKESEKSTEPPAVTPKEGETKNGVETPENVPNDKPLDDPAKGVDPNGEPHPGKAPHVEPTETPEGEQPGKKAETVLGDVFGTRMW